MVFDIIAAIGAGTKALEALRALQEVDKNLSEASWKAKVADLIGNVADMKVALIGANDELHTLSKLNDELQAKLKFVTGNTTSQNGNLYEIFENAEVSEFPFCQNCMVDGLYVRIIRGAISSSNAFCPRCKTHYDFRSVYRPKN